MCRRNHLFGCAFLAFGLGLLIGIWIEGGFLAHCFGFFMIFSGCCLWKKK